MIKVPIPSFKTMSILTHEAAATLPADRHCRHFASFSVPSPWNRWHCVTQWWHGKYTTVRETGRQTDRQTYRQTDNQTDRHTDRQTTRQIDREPQTDRQTVREVRGEAEGGRQVGYNFKASSTCRDLGMTEFWLDSGEVMYMLRGGEGTDYTACRIPGVIIAR